MGSGGGLTVGRELSRYLALARPGWQLILCAIDGHPLHASLKSQDLPTNCRLLFAPPQTRQRSARHNWERQELPRIVQQQSIHAVVQLNGMVVSTVAIPTLCHMQDPWPYRPEAWDGWKDRIVAAFKRREHRRALKSAAAFTWTSDYLRNLTCGHHGIWPAISEVIYNGVPEQWLHRAESSPPLHERPNQMVTVSNVNNYKRQRLVIEALPQLLQEPALRDLTYHIVGECAPGYDAELRALAARLEVEKHVQIHGRVDEPAMISRYEQAKCFVLMSVCESFGIPAIEAMSFGTPVVVADCCAIPEVCGDAADLAPVDDVAALARHLRRVLLDPEYAQTLRQRGGERVGHFRWSAIAERMADILEQVIPR
jgi:glycosyltransferase involved in cell wall biosynthesis